MKQTAIYMYYDKRKASFEEMLQLEYKAMLKASLSDHILFIAHDSEILGELVFISLN